MTHPSGHCIVLCFLMMLDVHVYAFRFKEAASNVISPISPPSAPDLSKLLEAEARSHRDCEERLRKLDLEAASEVQLTEEERSVKCENEVAPELHKIPLAQRPQIKPDMIKACLELEAEKQKEVKARQKERRRLQDQCTGLTEGFLKDVTGGLSEETRQEASLLGYDLSSLESQMTREAAEQLRASFAALKACDHDWNTLCPFAWKPLANGITCQAPKAYIGPCNRTLDFALSAAEKRDKEFQCLISWPCLQQCTRDYAALCPDGWTELGDGLCSAPASYSGLCLRRMNFLSLTPCVRLLLNEASSPFSQPLSKQRQLWSKACQANWPCESPCQRDYLQPCPESWRLLEDETCEAPPQYAGPCGRVETIAFSSPELKALFEAKCQVFFPCLESKCQSDFSQACPDGWNQEDNFCTAPEAYQGPCAKSLPLQAVHSEYQRRDLETHCSVSWPCLKTECQRNFNGTPCPLEWKEERDACQAPSSYRGPCAATETFNKLSTEGRKKESLRCGVFWPCANGEGLTTAMVRGGPAPFVGGVIQLPVVGGPVYEETGKIVNVSPK